MYNRAQWKLFGVKAWVSIDVCQITRIGAIHDLPAYPGVIWAAINDLHANERDALVARAWGGVAHGINYEKTAASGVSNQLLLGPQVSSSRRLGFLAKGSYLNWG